MAGNEEHDGPMVHTVDYGTRGTGNLLPMLIAGLVLIVLGMAALLIFG